jgi:predicted ATPase
MLGDRTIGDVVDLPLMQDPEALATLDLLTSLSVPALYVDANLGALSICRAVNLNLECGRTGDLRGNGPDRRRPLRRLR